MIWPSYLHQLFCYCSAVSCITSTGEEASGDPSINWLMEYEHEERLLAVERIPLRR